VPEPLANGALLRFYVHEGHRYRGVLVWEWLLKTASELGVRGGSAFRAVAGFGRHHVLHEQAFFELAGSLTVEVEFIVTEAEAGELLERLRVAGLRIFFARMPAHFGVVNPDAEDEPEAPSSR
jgi:PII-like signaling protein